jgi:hypothetical protein
MSMSSSTQRGIQFVVIGLAILTPLIIILTLFKSVHTEQITGDTAKVPAQVRVLEETPEGAKLRVTYNTEGRGEIVREMDLTKRVLDNGNFTGNNVNVVYAVGNPTLAALQAPPALNFSRILMILVALGVVAAIVWYSRKANY